MMIRQMMVPTVVFVHWIDIFSLYLISFDCHSLTMDMK